MIMTPEEYLWFFTRSPRCGCGRKMEMFELGNGDYAYRCNYCILIVSLKAAGADFQSKSKGGKHSNQLRYCRL